MLVYFVFFVVFCSVIGLYYLYTWYKREDDWFFKIFAINEMMYAIESIIWGIGYFVSRGRGF